MQKKERLLHTLVHDWLDHLSHVMMNVLRSCYWHNLSCVLALNSLDMITEFCLLVIDSMSCFLFIVMLEMTLFDWKNVAVMLLLECLRIGDRLDGSVVVVLVNFAVNGRDHFLMLLMRDGLMINCFLDLFMHSRIMMTVFDP